MNASDILANARVINLLKRPYRREQFAARYKYSTGLDARFELGFDGEKIEPPSGWETSRGAFGCALAHVVTLARILSDEELGDDDPVTIFEDDAIFCDGFLEKLEVVARIVPNDWDILYLGGEHLAGRPAPRLVAIEGEVGVALGYNVNRLHAYVLRRRSATSVFHRLLAYLTNAPIRYGPTGDETCFDYEIGRMTEEGLLKTYAATPFLVGQGGFGSDTYPQKSKGTLQDRYWN